MDNPIRTVDDLDVLSKQGRGVILAGPSPRIMHTVACTVLPNHAGGADGDRGAPIKGLTWHANAAIALKRHPGAEYCPACEPLQAEKLNALNRSGAFLHTVIYDMLVRQGYDPTHEVPVLAAPLVQDPTVMPSIYRRVNFGKGRYVKPDAFEEHVANIRNHPLARQRTIDVVSTVRRAKSRRMETVLCIEVKRRDPCYVDWVFMRRSSGCDALHVVGTEQGHDNDDGSQPLLRVGESIKVQDKSVCIKSDLLRVGNLREAYDVASALTLDEKVGYAFQKQPVFEAANQAVEGTSGLLIDKLVEQVKSGDGYDTTRYYLPVIVTSANLYACDYESTDINESKGDISRISLQKIDLLAYDHPTPAAARLPARDTGGSTYRHPEEKWQVVVATASGLEQLCSQLRHAERDSSHSHF